MSFLENFLCSVSRYIRASCKGGWEAWWKKLGGIGAKGWKWVRCGLNSIDTTLPNIHMQSLIMLKNSSLILSGAGLLLSLLLSYFRSCLSYSISYLVFFCLPPTVGNLFTFRPSYWIYLETVFTLLAVSRKVFLKISFQSRNCSVLIPPRPVWL